MKRGQKKRGGHKDYVLQEVLATLSARGNMDRHYSSERLVHRGKYLFGKAFPNSYALLEFCNFNFGGYVHGVKWSVYDPFNARRSKRLVTFLCEPRRIEDFIQESHMQGKLFSKGEFERRTVDVGVRTCPVCIEKGGAL